VDESSSITEVVEESSGETAVELPTEEAEPRPKRASRSRGGAARSRPSEPRPRRSPPKRKPPANAQLDSSPDSSARPASSTARRAPSGADKHLADDVPVDHDPPPPPRSFGDLDEIPGELE
jgi:hypothetical protein